jgi:GTP-binding protein HflX
MNAILVGVNINNDYEFDYSIQELENLVKALDIHKITTITQNLKEPNDKYLLGKGKLLEIKNLISYYNPDVIIFDNELSPAQNQNIQEILEIEVLDRTALILKIFALRAKTYEAKLQVEIASLKYELPRLSLVDANFSQQSGGSGVKNKGTGEKQIELDRRKIRTRINFLEKELEKVTKNRLNQRKKRIRNEIPKVALVGYTNAGKSSLLNTLLDYSITTNEKKIVMEKDMLFATLDTSTRLIKLPSNKEFLVSDTVGFINKLPTTLIKAFRSTLEEALDADLILLVSDISNKNNDLQLQVTLDTLNTIEANSIPILYVFNKCDLIEYEYEAKRSDAIIVSTKTKQGIDELLKAIEDNIFRNYINCMMHIPYEEGKIYSYLSENANISIRIEDNEGYLLSLELKEKDYNKYIQYVIKEEQ